MANICLAMPTHDTRAVIGAARGVFQTASRFHSILPLPSCSSLIAQNCNGMLSNALDLIKDGFTWLAMLHTDITPEVGWVDILMGEAFKYKADFVSALVPIKNEEGSTSTGIDDPNDEWNPWTRLTMSQVRHEKFPETADIGMVAKALDELPEDLRLPGCPTKTLLANTGCMVCRIDRDWMREGKVCFDDRNRIVTLPDGTHQAQTQSEDWWFTRELAKYARVMVTKKVKCTHQGRKEYSNQEVWGDSVDRHHDPRKR